MAEQGKYLLSDDSVDEREMGRDLLAMLMAYAPNMLAQKILSDMYQEMEKDGLGQSEINAHLLAGLFDGIYHSNWPWTRVLKA